MKYLKLFERFESHSSFYHEISIEEYEECLFMDDFPKDWQKFSEEEINEIKSAISDDYSDGEVVIDFNRDIEQMYRLEDEELHPIDPNFTYIITIESEDDSKKIQICKTIDEWYFTQVIFSCNEPLRLFRCDQFDGLIEFLKNEI